jgi:hypothetical protein
MWILLLEAGVALFLLIFIVWWTMSGKKPDRPSKSEHLLPQDGSSSPKPDQEDLQ